MGTTKIEWADATWSPVTGCTPVSKGCQNCYAKRMAQRLKGRAGYPADEPFRVTFHPDRLDQPLHWKKPRRIFLCSMGDLFHEDVPLDVIAAIHGVMMYSPWHTHLLLTKRPKRAAAFYKWLIDEGTKARYLDPLMLLTDSAKAHGCDLQPVGKKADAWYKANCNQSGRGKCDLLVPWPLPSVWLGVTAENQARANERVPLLLECPAAVKFVSVEPMLQPINLTRLCQPSGDEINGLYGWTQSKANGGQRGYGATWVIIGCETGPSRRPCRLEWVRDLVAQAKQASLPVFVKQLEINGRVSRDPAEWPADLRVREHPRPTHS